MEEKTVFINSLKANFKMAGEGPAILILHGWGGSSSSWVKVQGILSAKGYRVICPDFPGFGKSNIPKEPWTITDYVNWVFDFAKSQRMDKFFLLGHSFGGRIAIKFAVTFPEKIKSLILCNSSGIKKDPDFKTEIIFLFSRIGNMLFSAKILARFKDGARNFFYIFLRRKDYVKAKGMMKEIIKKVLEEDLFPYLNKIEAATLIIWGKEDKLVSVKDASIFNKEIKNSQLEILPEAGHSPHLESPGKLTDIIVNFLKKA